MKLIIAPLILLIIVALSVQFVSLGGFTSSYDGTSTIDSTNQQLIDLGVIEVSFNLVLITGFLTLFVSIAIIGILSGLNISVLGSTVQIHGRSQSILYNTLFYGGLWGIFSTLATVGLSSGIGLFDIPVFGIVLYAIMTLFYVLGINGQIQGGDDTP